MTSEQKESYRITMAFGLGVGILGTSLLLMKNPSKASQTAIAGGIVLGLGVIMMLIKKEN